MKMAGKLAGLMVVSGAFVVGTAAEVQAAPQIPGIYACTNVHYGAGGVSAQFNPYASTVCSYADHTGMKSGTIVTAEASLRAATTQIADLVSQRIANVNAGDGAKVSATGNGFNASSGVSSGDTIGEIGVWTSGAWSQVENNNAATLFDGQVWNALVGMDYAYDDRLIVGISGGYDSLAFRTQFNESQFTGEDGSLDMDGYSVVPYASYKIIELVNARISGGYSWLDYDSIRFDRGTGEKITGSTDSKRYFVNTALDTAYNLSALRLRGSIGWLYSTEEKDAFRESNGVNVAKSDTDLSQGRAGAEIGYDLFGIIEPYAKAMLEYDFVSSKTVVAANQITPQDEEFGADVGGGVRFTIIPAVTGAVEGTTHVGRENYREHTVNGNLRVEF